MTNSQRNAYLLRTYRITEAEFEAIVEYQGGGCAGCGRKRRGRSLHVDHDHKTGLVRGIVCWRCNSLLGKALDTASTLRNLADYLMNPPAVAVVGRRIAPPLKKRRRRRTRK